MPEIAIVPARATHIKPIAAAMSGWDRIETRAFGQCPRTALRMGLVGSTHVWTAMVNGRPEFMFGVTPVSLWEGRVWALGTDEARRHKRAVIQLGATAIAEMLAVYGRLSNFVAAGNRKARLALRYWGASEGEPVEIGGYDFLPFVIGRG